MKYLLINADDFGYSQGINKGIIEAHTKGIVTSTSLMVDGPAAGEASSLNDYEELSVGLHFVAPNEQDKDLGTELNRQVAKFKELMGYNPSHIDAHKIQPSSQELIRKVFEEYSQEHHTPVRSLGQAKLIKSFFGLNIDGSGALDESRVSIDGFRRALAEVDEGYNELMCHVGYSDEYLRSHSSYNDIREKELEALVSEEAKKLIKEAGITLCSWKEVKF